MFGLWKGRNFLAVLKDRNFVQIEVGISRHYNLLRMFGLCWKHISQVAHQGRSFVLFEVDISRQDNLLRMFGLWKGRIFHGVHHHTNSALLHFDRFLMHKEFGLFDQWLEHDSPYLHQCRIFVPNLAGIHLGDMGSQMIVQYLGNRSRRVQ